MSVHYNEIDPFAAGWMRNLAAAGLIAPGEVNEQDIRKIKAATLDRFTQCHFFAGIGAWSYALRAAGWPDTLPVWTGSCPCQPFSSGGKGEGFDDSRHLWPAWFRLIRQCRPLTIFGEQVAKKDGLAWFDVVSADLESLGYAVGAAVVPACGFGAPHARERLFFVADAQGAEPQGKRAQPDRRQGGFANRGIAGRMADHRRSGRNSRIAGDAGRESEARTVGNGAARHRSLGELADTAGSGNDHGEHERIVAPATGPVNGFWREAEWIHCRPEPKYPEGRWWPVEPGSFPLAHGIAARVGRLRGYGNAIVAPQAQAFIEAYLETREGTIDG